MKISINWLDEWVEVADLDPQELAHELTMAGLEVDAISYVGDGHGDIVVGEITAIEEHPDADRLVVCKVVADDTKQEHTIVCGATNMEAGDRVPVALPGSSPPGVDFDIVARQVMGIGSEGMLCSGEELELEDDSDGLMIVDGDLELGVPIFEALEATDVVLEIDLTPNRADCLSHRGVAREVAAIYDRDLRGGAGEVVSEVGGDAEFSAGDRAQLKVVDDEGCPQYRLAIIEDLEIGTSPQWLRRRLKAVGIRPVNSVVDITNYVLHDVGQPLHAFDLDTLQGEHIEVRRASGGETLVGIDHEDYELNDEDLIIADDSGPVALAGVMGGAETEVSASTSRILLECAWFDPTTVRRTSKRHGLHTDSSHRFERGVDAGAVDDALRRAVGLIDAVQREIATAPTVANGEVVADTGRAEPTRIELDPERCSTILGVDVDKATCAEYLESIGVDVGSVDGDGDGLLDCRVPSYRRDLRRPIDLIEELARLHGYDEIPATLPAMTVGEGHQKKSDESRETIAGSAYRKRIDWVRNFLLDRGLLEAINYSFMGEEHLDRLRLDDDDCRRRASRVANPLVASQEMMRTTLIPGLLDNLQTNFSHSRQDVALFEIGRRYFEETGEQQTVAMALTGRRDHHWTGDRTWDFFDVKGLVESMVTPWDIDDTSWGRPEVDEPYLHPGVQAQWMWKDRILGFVGRLHPAVEQSEGFEQPVFVAELDLATIADAGPRRPVAESPPKYPAVVRDFALLYADDRPYGELRRAVEGLAAADESFGAIFEAVELFDVYEGEQVPEGLRSLAIKVTYRSDTETLEESDVEAADRQLLSHLEEKVDAKLR